MKRTEKEGILNILRNEFSQLNISTLQANHSNLWNNILGRSVKVLDQRDKNISNKFGKVIQKITTSSHFTPADDNDIVVFMGSINSSGINSNNWINNLPGLLQKNNQTPSNYMNGILDDKNFNISNFEYGRGAKGKACRVFYSIVKHFQEPSKYLIYYKFWEF